MLPTATTPPPSMLPTTTPPPPYNPSKKSKLKSTLHTANSILSAHHCVWLTLIVLLQLLIILFPPTLLHLESSATADEACKHGRIYVYNLPSMLNKDLLDNCRDLDPWIDFCNAVSNGGLGSTATGLDTVVPWNLSAAWHWTEMYMAEVIYHDRMNNYRCTTSNPAEATAFYVPFYAGLAVRKYLLSNYTSKDRDLHAAAMLNWIKNQPPWRRINGSDHFMMLGRPTWDFRRFPGDEGGWGTGLINMPLMKNVFRLTVERNRWDDLELSVPYPTSFHPRSEFDIRQWQTLIRSRQRSSLFTFVGSTRKWIQNDFRSILMEYCKNETASCRLVDCSKTPCSDGAPAILEAFLDSDFCLQPKGDAFTRRSMFDCMLAGSIPVYFWNGSFEYQYDWHLPKNASTYSVFIHNKTARNDTSIIEPTLEKYSKEEVMRMRETIIEFLPKLLYSKSNANLGGISDAFDIAVQRVLKKFELQRRSMAV